MKHVTKLCALALLFLLCNCGKDDSSSGVVNPGSLPLVKDFNQVLENAYQGAFHIPAAKQQHKQYPAVTSYGAVNYISDPNRSASFAFAPSEDDEIRFFLGGFGGGFNNASVDGNNGGGIESITEFTISRSDLSKGTPGDRTGYVDAVRKQDWLGVFDPSLNLMKSTGGSHIVTGMYYNRNDDYLYINTEVEYPGLYPMDNLLRIKNPDKLHKDNIEGYYQMRVGAEVGKGSHTASWIADIPKGWQNKLGGKHLMGGGGSFSILDRLPCGPTLFTGDFDAITEKSGDVSLNRLMDFDDKPGEQLGAYLHGSPQNWYNYEMYNCDRTAGYNCGQAITHDEYIVPWINDWWTVITAACHGFIIPNTRTYVVLGRYQGKEGFGYKLVSDYKQDCGGPCRQFEDDYYNQYWLFDLDEILRADEPFLVFPYEYGRITFLDSFLDRKGMRASILNAGFDIHTGQLAIILSKMEGEYAPTNDALIFQDDAWVD